MKKRIRLLILLLFILSLKIQAQITPSITARVDTTNTENKKVYDVYVKYINSQPDSLYHNPYWNKKEIEEAEKSEAPNFNRSAIFMFMGIDADTFYETYPPKILSIEKVDKDRYAIRIIYENDSEHYKEHSPSYITKLYAVKNKDGKFRLENTLNYDTKNWKTYSNKFINYIISPSVDFKKKEAKETLEFCKMVTEKLEIENVSPFTYYIASNSEEMGKLFNFDYWLYYSTGIADTRAGIIYTSFGKASYPHEFVHMLSNSLVEDNKGTAIINEGLATWLGGPSINETYKESLYSFSEYIRNNDTISIDEIKNNKYRNEFDNTPIYITGAVICEMAYNQKGLFGLKKLMNATDENFKTTLENVFDKPYSEIDDEVINYIKGFSNK